MERIGTYGTSILTPMAFVPSVSFLFYSYSSDFDLDLGHCVINSRRLRHLHSHAYGICPVCVA